MQYAPTEFVTSASGCTSLGLGLYATFTCVDTYGRDDGLFRCVGWANGFIVNPTLILKKPNYYDQQQN